MSRNAFGRWGRYLVATVLAAVVTWFAFVAKSPVPILDLFDLGIHEVGHLLFAIAPPTVMFLAGSAVQVVVPLALAWYFGVRQGDPAGGGFCLAWAGASLWDVSVYVADAPVQLLPLIGGGIHDWAFLLGPEAWDVLHRSGEIAGFLEFSGAVLAGTGILVTGWALLLGLRRPAPFLQSAPDVGLDLPSPKDASGDPWRAAADLPFHHRPAVGE